MSLSNKTYFITGASRGIGKAIGLRLAREGANIVIAAKTDQPHKTLPGTIHTAAEEMEAAGGKALALKVDIRDEHAVQTAIDTAAEHFGGINGLVNNASAISLTGTLATPMRRFDLLFSVNVRGTYACSQAALPHLLKHKTSHILNLAPPLNMSPQWFKNHGAYTMSKYGMSMCVLGMAAEFADRGVAVNALWPKTAIATSALRMAGDDGVDLKHCRKPEIMADAAYEILCNNTSRISGRFLLDEEVMVNAGITDLNRYAVEPGQPLLRDFFV